MDATDAMNDLQQYDYDLPAGLIAKYPAERRDASRMMVINRAEGTITHAQFADFEAYRPQQSLVVLNNARVFPARLRAEQPQGEIFFLEAVGSGEWRVLTRPARRFQVGSQVRVAGMDCVITREAPLGVRYIQCPHPPDFDTFGEIPLPPYLGRAAEAGDRERYQTVYAERTGAVAAPTAGLHVTPELLERLPTEFVTLYVGEGTFRDIKTDRVDDHIMHSERYEITPAAAESIRAADHVLAVGTTVVRTLESAARHGGGIQPGPDETDLFIRPGFEFRRVNSLLTNFHLPKSTLLILVSAFAGMELTREAYRKAVEERYRFFSYGDCMLIV